MPLRTIVQYLHCSIACLRYPKHHRLYIEMVHVLCVTLFFLGCEFFRDYKENGFNPVNLHFDWSQVQLLVANNIQQLWDIRSIY